VVALALVLVLALVGCGFGSPRASSIDARPGDGTEMLIEAESHTINLTMAGKTWMPVSSADASGGAFMQVQPDNNTGSCMDPSLTALALCSPVMEYQVAIPADGLYHFHARMLSNPGGEENSIWFGTDNTVHAPYFNHDTETGVWAWEVYSTGPINLSAGKHDLTVWMREDGARLDAMALSRSSSFP
jgi:hypothetical protein